MRSFHIFYLVLYMQSNYCTPTQVHGIVREEGGRTTYSSGETLKEGRVFTSPGAAMPPPGPAQQNTHSLTRYLSRFS